jgi:nitroreductase
MNILETIQKRRSVRAFLPDPISPHIITQILTTAQFAPSGCNTQPWQVAILGTEHRQKLVEKILAARAKGITEQPDYDYYPKQWIEPYKSRRFACGMALYGALKIAHHDKEARQKIWDLNYYFFNAPVGLIFYIDRHLQTGSYIDIGMFIQNVMLAARHFNLETCAQASFADYPEQVRDVLSLDENQIIICGMAMGYANWDAAINLCHTDRIDVEQFTHWYN